MTTFDQDESSLAEADYEPVLVVVGDPPPAFSSLTSWVEHSYVTCYIRKLSQTLRWCPQWWAHPEAIVRLTALWQTWESARASKEPAAMADWLRTYLDAINPVLLSPDGPFSSCTLERHTDNRPQPVTLPPAGHFNTDD